MKKMRTTFLLLICSILTFNIFVLIKICFLSPACVVSVLKRCDLTRCSLPTLETGARNLRNLFSKLLILQNNQPPSCKHCQSPCWTMVVLFTWKTKLAWAAAFINFPFLFSPTTCLSWHGEGPSWAQQAVLCAWHHLKLVQVSGGLFAALPPRMFADPNATV